MEGRDTESIKLTRKQKAAILQATPDRDYCVIAHGTIMASLVEKELAKYTGGFGYKWGAIIELTALGIKIRNSLYGI